MGALHFGAALCSCISLLCLLVALGTDYWATSSTIHFGLWKYCEGQRCYPEGVEWVSASVQAIRTFMFLGMIAGALSLGGLCARSVQCSLGNVSMGWIAYIASFTAGLCVLIAMAIFTGKIGTINVYGWSFFLGWASVPFYLLTGWLAYKLHKDNSINTE